MAIKRTLVFTTWVAPGSLAASFQPLKLTSFECHHCHQRTNVIPDVIVDAECDMWRHRCEALQSLITEQIKKFNAKHGTDPFEIEWLELMRELRELMNNYKDTREHPKNG